MHTVILKKHVLFFTDKCIRVKTGKFANREESQRKYFQTEKCSRILSLDVTWNKISVFLLRKIFSAVLVDKDFQILRLFVRFILVSR